MHNEMRAKFMQKMTIWLLNNKIQLINLHYHLPCHKLNIIKCLKDFLSQNLIPNINRTTLI